MCRVSDTHTHPFLKLLSMVLETWIEKYIKKYLKIYKILSLNEKTVTFNMNQRISKLSQGWPCWFVHFTKSITDKRWNNNQFILLTIGYYKYCVQRLLKTHQWDTLLHYVRHRLSPLAGNTQNVDSSASENSPPNVLFLPIWEKLQWPAVITH